MTWTPSAIIDSESLVGQGPPISVVNPANEEVIAEIPEADEALVQRAMRSEEHTSELQSLMRISYAVFCLKNKMASIPFLHVRTEVGYTRWTAHRHHFKQATLIY